VQTGRQRNVVAWVAAVVVASTALLAADKVVPEHKYIGVGKCAKLCHKTSKQGKQLTIWSKSKHAHAYKTLLTDEAKATAKKLGIDAPEKSPKCLKCHAIGWNVDEAHLKSGFKVEDGVQCETCHGPGDDYEGKKVMKDREKAIAAGLIVGDKETCLKCHNDTAPSWKPDRYTTADGKKVGFDYDLLWPKIAHPRPKKD